MHQHLSENKQRIATPASARMKAPTLMRHGTMAGNRPLAARIAPAPVTLQAKLAVNQPGDIYEQEADRVADKVMRMSNAQVQRKCAACAEGDHKIGTGMLMRSESMEDVFMEEEPIEKAPMEDSAEEAKAGESGENKACTRTILSEGTCEFLVKNSKWVCCDPKNGVEDKSRSTSIAEPGKECPSQKWTSIFSCDKNCDNAVKKGCSDSDNWMAIPKKQFKPSKCGDTYTICANGKQTTGYVRDKSVTDTRYEVSPGIQKTLGVKVGSSFKGAIYAPGAAQTAIDKDKCCKST